MSVKVTVSKVTQLHRVAVVELSSDNGASFDDAIQAARSQSRIIVIDCVARHDLPREFIDDLAGIQGELRPDGGHLIVVNAPDTAIRDLRFLGIDAATTTDLRFEPSIEPGFGWEPNDALGSEALGSQTG
jgi:hypothetical protein